MGLAHMALSVLIYSSRQKFGAINVPDMNGEKSYGNFQIGIKIVF